MNHSRAFATILSGLTLLAVGAVAQSSGSSGSPASSPSSQPSTSAPSSVTTAPSANAPASVTTRPSSATNTPATTTTRSGVNSPGSATTPGATPTDAATRADANANATTGWYGPGASQFTTIDTDSDGRISRAEFTASASNSAAMTRRNSGDMNRATPDGSVTPAGERRNTWSSASDNKVSGNTDPVETFTKLDTDNDGFLSHSELARANATKPRD